MKTYRHAGARPGFLSAFPSTFEEFQGASYAERYNILCRKLAQEQLYTTASILTSPRSASADGGRHLERRMLSLTGPDKLQIKVWVMGVDLSARVSIRFRCDQANGRVVHALFVGVRVGLDVPFRLFAPPRHGLPSDIEHFTGRLTGRRSYRLVAYRLLRADQMTQGSAPIKITRVQEAGFLAIG